VRLHIVCPNCETPAKAYRSRRMSGIVTEVGYNCHNHACGANFIATVEVSRYIRLPSFINPQVHVPLSPFVEKRQLMEALERLQVAELGEQGEIVSKANPQRDIFDDMPLAPAGGP
jgi:hypothetical protein